MLTAATIWLAILGFSCFVNQLDRLESAKRKQLAVWQILLIWHALLATILSIGYVIFHMVTT